SRKTVKSKASRVQPNHAAHQAYHWSLVGSFHHGMLFTVSTAAIVLPPLPTCCFYRAAELARARDHATTKSGTISTPLGPGRSGRDKQKTISPTMAPPSIGIANPMCHNGAVAKNVRIGGPNPPAIAPTW